MLELIREKMQGVFATVIVVFFCAVFALWGVESLFNRNSSKVAIASVDGQDISEPELANAIQNLRQRYVQMLGDKVDPKFLNDSMLREPALNSLISRKLLEKQAESMNMTIDQKTLERVIVSDPLFSRDGKSFDPEYYKEKLRSAGISAVSYQMQLRDQLILSQLQQGVSSSAFITDKQVEEIARLELEKRSFSYVRFLLNDVMKSIQPDDKLVEQYYKDHQNDFLTDEKVTIEYLELDKADLAKDIKLDDADVKASYEQEIANFKPVAERHAAHILVEAKDDGTEKATLETISKRLKAGDDFAVLAKKYSSDEGSAAQGGDVGFTSGATFVPEFEAALAALENNGDVSEPIKTEFGYHFIKLLEQRTTSVPAYEQRKADLEKQLRQARSNTVFSEKLDQLSESTYSADDLAGPASELGLAVQKTAPFSRQGGLGLAGQQKVIDAAYSSELIDSGKNSQVIELSADKAVVLRVVDHNLPKVRELVDVKSDIINKLKSEQASVVLKDKVSGLAARLAGGEALKSIATNEKLDIVSLTDKGRTDAGVDAELLKAAFQLAKPSENGVVADSIQMANGDRVLLQLTAVKAPEVKVDSPEFQSTKRRMMTEVGNNDFALFEQYLRETTRVTTAAAPSNEQAAAR